MTSFQQSALPTPAFLDTHRQDELDALFASLSATSAAELNGNYEGRLIGILGLSGLPKLAKGLTYGMLGTWINPWRGKQFMQTSGANQWGIGRHTSSWGEYSISESSDNASLMLDYNVAANPKLLRPILGEVRQLSNGLWLARMRYRTKDDIKTLLYFTLREVH
tara:strand:+ start:827 stop:1318 length:492 start_codon:yes stop_codon:yes gene_type:complete